MRKRFRSSFARLLSPSTALFLLAALLNTWALAGSAGAATIFSENFDALTPPALPSGWAMEVVVAEDEPIWATSEGTNEPLGEAGHSSPNVAYFNSYSTSSSGSARLYKTASLNLNGAVSPQLAFWMYHDTGYSSSEDKIQPQVSTDGGATWIDAGAAVNRYDDSEGWRQETLDLSSYVAGQSDVRIGFLAISDYGNDCHIDDVELTCIGDAPPQPPIFTQHFSPASIPFGETSRLTFIIDNSANTQNATGLSFTDNLPDGLFVATPPNASVTCIGGSLTANAGSGSISYSGGSVAAGSNCTIQVDVIGKSTGVYENITGNLSSSSGNSGVASDVLTVDWSPPAFSSLLEQNLLLSPQIGPGWTTDLVNLSGSETLRILSINVQAFLRSCGASSEDTYRVKIYLRQGTANGYQDSAAGWTLAGWKDQSGIDGLNPGTFMEVPLVSPVDIPPGSTAGLYAVIHDGIKCNVAPNIYYTGLGGLVTSSDSETNDGILQINNAPGHWVDGLFNGILGDGGYGSNLMPQVRVTYALISDIPCPPIVTTQTVTDIGATTATGHGTITDLGIPDPTAHGVCWNTGGTPTTADNHTDEGATNSTEAFTSSMTALSPGVTYSVRAYATNTMGTAYGEEVLFTTGEISPGIPTLSEWGMFLFVILMAGTAAVFQRRRNPGA